MNLGNKLKKLRKSQNLTLNDICQKTSLTSEYLNKLENNLTKHIILDKVIELANFYNVDICFLIKDELTLKKDISIELKKIFNDENLEYLKIIMSARKNNFSADETRKILNTLFNVNSEEYKYYKLAMKAKEKNISTKKLSKTIDLLNIEKKVGLFPRCY
jgi:transcriptional regulator with XRE-family HTH domain